jgi:hypothetical protein
MWKQTAAVRVSRKAIREMRGHARVRAKKDGRLENAATEIAEG